MENYKNDIIRKIFEIFDKLEINPEDFVKHLDEDDYIDQDAFKRAFFKYLIYRAHLGKYIEEESSEDSESSESEDSEDYTGGGKIDCDEVFRRTIVYAISKNVDKYNDIVEKLVAGLDEEFGDDSESSGKISGGSEMINKLCFYWFM